MLYTLLQRTVDMSKNKTMFVAVAAIAVALTLAVAPALTSQAFAQGEQGRGHTCKLPSGTECQGESGEKNPQAKKFRGSSHIEF